MVTKPSFWIILILVLFAGIIGFSLIMTPWLLFWWVSVLVLLFLLSQHVCPDAGRQWYYLLFLIFLLTLMLVWLGFECSGSVPLCGSGVLLAVVIILLLMLLTWRARKIHFWTMGLVLIALWLGVAIWSLRTKSHVQ